MRPTAIALALFLSLPSLARPPIDLDTESPYYPGRNYPKLVTPQWIGEPGVDAVVILAIDDMRDHRRYETFLRPILERLQKIDVRAPVSIMTNKIDPATPLLQQWLREGLSIDAHTADHPCPILAGGDFQKAKSTYDRCVDQLFAIPGNLPVAFRTPCCDSLNTPSPRLFAEIFNKTTPGGRFLTVDSSVFNITTANDPDLPRELVLLPDGRERFRKYVPFESFVNTIEDYPYPYVLGRLCWEFPCATPSDWQAQFVQKPANPQTTADWKAQLDVTVIKRGVMTMVFHPHGWSTPEQFIELIDYAAAKYGRRVKFLNFREASDRLTKHLTSGVPLRGQDGTDSGVRLIDLNRDGYLDVVLGGSRTARVWKPQAQDWAKAEYPAYLGAAETLVQGNARGYLRDLDRDSRQELIIDDRVFRWSGDRWTELSYRLPAGTSLSGGGLLVDVDEDGLDDLAFADAARSALYLFVPEKGWTRKVFDHPRGDRAAKVELPPIVRGDGSNNGVWVHSRMLWWQNEDTAKLPNLVDRRTFDALLKDVEPTARTPAASLNSMKVAPGYKVELVAAEPLVQDPVAFSFGPDGRLWVVEMGDYPSGVDGKGKPGGRVRYLEDADGDGTYEKSTSFLEDLPFPTSVLPWRKGVLVTAAPDLLYAEDADGDGRAERREVLFTGFKEGNQQHRVNHLSFGVDNWVYGANGDSGGTVKSLKKGKSVSISGRDFRCRPDTGEFEAVSGQSQFGRSRTDAGDWFGCNNVNPLWHFPLDEHYLKRNPHVPAPANVLRVDVPTVPGSSPVFPLSRLLPRFNDLHTANHFTSACSSHVYRDDLLLRGSNDGRGTADSYQVFISEPVHNLVSRQVMTARGVTFTSARAAGERSSEFLTSSDHWFRPTTVATGPDGALYVADMYRQTIEHPEWIPKDWQARLDLRAGHSMGRIYRVVPVGAERRPVPRLDRLDDAGLVAAIDSVNGPQRDLAQWMLLWRASPASIAPLERLARTSTNPLARLHALCTLDGLSAVSSLKPEIVVAALADASPVVRRHAVRIAEDRADAVPKIGDALLHLADDPDPQVRLQLAYTLGGLPDPRAAGVLGHIATSPAADRFLLAAALSSLNERNVGAVVAAATAAAERAPLSPVLLAGLTRTAIGVGKPEAIGSIVRPAVTPREGRFEAWQFRTLANLLDALEEAKTPLARVMGSGSGGGGPTGNVDDAIGAARAQAGNSSAPVELRAATVPLLGRDKAGRSGDLEMLRTLLAPQAPAELQSAVISTIARRGDVDLGRILVERWKGLTPALRAAALDALISRPARAAVLLDAVEARAITPTEMDAARRQRLLGSADKTVRERARQLLAESVNPDRQKVIDRFAPALNLTGNPTRGQAVFANACATCHRLGDLGKPVGPDLAAVGDKSPQGLLIAILDPNRAVEARYVNYIATTADGQAYTGLLAGESATAITLLGPDAQQETLRRQDIEDLRSSNTSLMPDGLEANLTPQDLADLIAFVRQGK